jgi:hypothetical protein
VSLTELFAAAPQVAAVRHPPLALMPSSSVKGGQIWFVEAAAEAMDKLIAGALAAADAVIYDRRLGKVLPDALPLGTYAEPANGSGNIAEERCVGFARDGWSVARLLPARLPQRERMGHIRGIVNALTAARVPGSLRVRVMAEIAAGIREETIVSLDRLADIVATYERPTALTIAIDAFAGTAATLYPAAANGLAG